MEFDLFNGDKPFVELPFVRIVVCYECGYLETPEPESLASVGQWRKTTCFCEVCGKLSLVLELVNREYK